MEEDQVIIAQVLQGNKEAYAEIISRYHGKVISVLRKMQGHTSNEQDTVQEIFIKTYYLLPNYKPTYTFSAWLYRIAANYCVDELRRRIRAPELTHDHIEAVDHDTPETSLLKKEEQLFLKEQMMSVEEKYRVVLELRYLEHFSCEEIGEKLDIPSSTVRTRLSRGKDKLRTSISRTGRRSDFGK
ncbi:sigma-70 family RNA polymerase sigma factor [Brevibacillus fortis]|uniref:RNA polymerase n=1 Tax=Brevibacillus fortis TaxID=2126352 RepID=A0A2P7UKU5_9BACL|nr:sigma-70 family RNA polymerase sigma factor [Brevibacillus fortis]MED1785741.1 sigma-70 family RNA polymerase sigma factor [Brevibacillus fortis]PSJ87545.1 RNA polymerase [Brevibacillus fortis]